MYINDLNTSRAIMGVIGSTISSINNSFVDNYNKYGSFIAISNFALTGDDSYYSSGGALCIDSSELNTENSKFTGNYAEHGEDILLYDSNYDISGSSCKNYR